MVTSGYQECMDLRRDTRMRTKVLCDALIDVQLLINRRPGCLIPMSNLLHVAAIKRKGPVGHFHY